MLTMTLCTILVSLWAIALELMLRRQNKCVYALCEAITKVAHGKARIVLNENNTPTFIPNTGE